MRFVLVHGGFHGAWCWQKLIPEIEHLGHEAIAIDLPGAGERLAEPASHASWRAALRAVVEDGDVLVGHSNGGFAISLAADEVPDRIARLVYLSAAVPIEGESANAATDDSVATQWPATVGLPLDELLEVVDVPAQGPCVRLTTPRAANALFYHDCSPEDQAWAWARLTPMPLAPSQEVFRLPAFWESTIPRDFLLTTDDRSHAMAEDNAFMRRLGLSTALSIDSSHSPFVSRPAETAWLLDRCAAGVLTG